MNDDGRGLDHKPTELVVETARLGGRRSALPGLVAALMVMTFIGVAVWKPWDTGLVLPGSSSRVPPASGDPSSGSATANASGHVLPVDGRPFPSNVELLAATTHQPAWGVRAMVLPSPSIAGQPDLVERWSAVPTPVGDGSAPPPTLTIAQSDDDVAAIGVTTLDDALPLDVRFWSLPTNGPPQRVAAIAIPGPEAGSWLWLPDRAHASDRGTWQAGDYEIEVLLGPRIVRLVATIPNASPTSNHVTGPGGQPPFEIVLQSLELGPFALADGGARSLGGGSPPVADEREAWLGPAAGFPPVAEIAARQVTGFGMLFAAGEEPVSIEVRRLAQGSAPIDTGVNILSVEPDQRRAIIAWPTFGSVFFDGVFHMTVTWSSGGADQSASWAVEVQPSIHQSPPNSPLDVMRRWFGLLSQPDNDAHEPLVFIPDATAGTDACSPSTTITGTDSLLGVVVPPQVRVVRVRMVPLDENRSNDIAIRYAPDAIPRLTVVALPPSGLPVRDYDLFLTLDSPSGETRIAQRVCVTDG